MTQGDGHMKNRFFAAAFLLCCAESAYADNWPCEVLLCMSNPAGPTAVAECKPPIDRLWKHLSKGRGWPVCDMASDSASQEWANTDNCPPQYIAFDESESGSKAYCTYSGAITIKQNGEPYMKVWWTPSGRSVTENLSPNAPVTEASQRFDADYVQWQAEQKEIAERRAAQDGG